VKSRLPPPPFVPLSPFSRSSPLPLYPIENPNNLALDHLPCMAVFRGLIPNLSQGLALEVELRESAVRISQIGRLLFLERAL